jgi:hypothetical protein
MSRTRESSIRFFRFALSWALSANSHHLQYDQLGPKLIHIEGEVRRDDWHVCSGNGLCHAGSRGARSMALRHLTSLLASI